MRDLAEVRKDALVLDACDRARLAEELLASLDDVSEEEASRTWAGEAEKRLSEFRSGVASASGSQHVAEKARKLFR